jgi:hypothetical protein
VMGGEGREGGGCTQQSKRVSGWMAGQGVTVGKRGGKSNERG